MRANASIINKIRLFDVLKTFVTALGVTANVARRHDSNFWNLKYNLMPYLNILAIDYKVCSAK